MKYDLVVFDLDGTILNTIDDLADSCNFVLNRHKFPTHTVEEIKYMVGNGIAKLIERACPADISKEEYETLKCQYAELEAKYNVLFAEKEESRILKMKEDTDAILSDEDEDLDEKTKEDLRSRRDAGEFADVEAFVRELSYRKYTAKKKVPAKVAYSARTTSTKKNEVVDDLDKI